MSTSPQILQTLESQLSHRLEKLWRVFSWCSSILITITGAVIAAARANQKPVLRSPQDHIIISLVIIIVTLYARAWINENLQFEKNIRKQIEQIFEVELNYPHLKNLDPGRAKFGYKDVIGLLGLVALAATWIDCFIK